MYARGMTVRDIQAHLTDLYGIDVSRDLISRVTDEVVEELRAWQQRPLEEVYPIVYIDALVVSSAQRPRRSSVRITSQNFAPSVAGAYLGEYVEGGHGGLKADRGRALDLYKRGCDYLFAKGCVNLGETLSRGSQQEKQQGRRYLQRGCDLGDSFGCKLLKERYGG